MDLNLKIPLTQRKGSVVTSAAMHGLVHPVLVIQWKTGGSGKPNNFVPLKVLGDFRADELPSYVLALSTALKLDTFVLPSNLEVIDPGAFAASVCTDSAGTFEQVRAVAESARGKDIIICLHCADSFGTGRRSNHICIKEMYDSESADPAKICLFCNEVVVNLKDTHSCVGVNNVKIVSSIFDNSWYCFGHAEVVKMYTSEKSALGKRPPSPSSSSSISDKKLATEKEPPLKKSAEGDVSGAVANLFTAMNKGGAMSSETKVAFSSLQKKLEDDKKTMVDLLNCAAKSFEELGKSEFAAGEKKGSEDGQSRLLAYKSQVEEKLRKLFIDLETSEADIIYYLENVMKE